MGLETILGYVFKTVFLVLENQDLIDALLNSDELTDEEREKIRRMRKQAVEEWESLGPRA